MHNEKKAHFANFSDTKLHNKCLKMVRIGHNFILHHENAAKNTTYISEIVGVPSKSTEIT